MRGGKRSNKPKSVRELHGSRTRARHREADEPVAPTGRPPKPETLSAVASTHWDYLAGILEQENRMTLSDGPWLESTARAYGELDRWRIEAENSPLTQTDPQSGKTTTHPAQQQLRLAWESYRKWLADGGVSPMARARVALPKAPEDKPSSPFADLQQRTAKLRLVK